MHLVAVAIRGDILIAPETVRYGMVQYVQYVRYIQYLQCVQYLQYLAPSIKFT